MQASLVEPCCRALCDFKEHSLDTLLADHILLRMNNVIITPHGAFNTRVAARSILDSVPDHIFAFAHNTPMNIVN